MLIVQESENAAIDPRWIKLRMSRTNLIINVFGVLVAIAILVLVPLPNWARIGLGVAFFAAFVWDLRLILLKGRRSVSAFYLFDLDEKRTQSNVPPNQAKLGIRVRYVQATGLLATNEAEGVILSGAFVSPWFTAIRYALLQDPAWRKWWPHIIPVWADSVAADAFRQLRVALKWK